MSSGYSQIGNDYPPESTGQNLSRTSVIVLNGNTTDSVAGNDINSFVVAKHDGTLAFPAELYNTGFVSIHASEIKVTNVKGEPISLALSLNGRIVSDITLNSALAGVRLNSDGGLLTGTDKVYPAGVTAGGSTLDVGFTTIGAATLQPGQSLWLDVSKNTAGTLIVQSVLLLIRPIF